jgi:hypothetical protein
MGSQARIAFGIAALGVLSVIAYFSFRPETAAPAPSAAAVSEPEPVAAASMPASAPSPPAPPGLPDYVPYAQLTRTAADQNRVIYTTSAMGEPMEVHPDGTVVIHNHRKVFTYADGHQEVRFARITAKPTWIPLSGLKIPAEDAPPK